MMICSNCGSVHEEGGKFCQNCGASLSEPSAPVPAQTLPPQNRPLSPWAYFGYQLLFGLPLVGFICLIVFSFSDENINRRNFARSYWVALLFGVIVTIVVTVLVIAFGVTDQLAEAIAESVTMYF